MFFDGILEVLRRVLDIRVVGREDGQSVGCLGSSGDDDKLYSVRSARD